MLVALSVARRKPSLAPPMTAFGQWLAKGYRIAKHPIKAPLRRPAPLPVTAQPR